MIENLMQKNNCNELHIQYDNSSGCTFVIAMNTIYGDKGNGGTRMMNYDNVEDGIKDAINLVNAMTKKCVVIGKEYNGGYSGAKGVIVGNPEKQKTPDMLRRYGQFVESLNGIFQTGSDMNIDLNDIKFMAEESKYVDGLESGLGDTAIPTAYGVFVAMEDLCKHKYGNSSLENKVVAVQGVGSVGEDLIRRLTDVGAKVIATDADQRKLESVKDRYGIEVVSPDNIYDVECDIFSPNACGGVLTSETIQRLDCDMVIGAANNPLADGLQSVKQMQEKGITYAPDYIVNIGGVFLSMCEVQGKDFDYVIEKTEEIISERLGQVIGKSETLYEEAERLIERELEL